MCSGVAGPIKCRLKKFGHFALSCKKKGNPEVKLLLYTKQTGINSPLFTVCPGLKCATVNT